jgi:chemotaxis response regulator CheB
VLGGLPADLPAAVVVGQHLGGQGSALVDILSRRTPLAVRWAADGLELLAGTVTVCPPRSVLEILPGRTCSVRPADGPVAARPSTCC